MGTKRERRTYSESFRAEAVALVVEHGVTAIQAARDLGMPLSTLQLWLHKARGDAPAAAGETLSATEREELKQLRRENRVLREEREILKKAAAFFAKETR